MCLIERHTFPPSDKGYSRPHHAGHPAAGMLLHNCAVGSDIGMTHANEHLHCSLTCQTGARLACEDVSSSMQQGMLACRHDHGALQSNADFWSNLLPPQQLLAAAGGQELVGSFAGGLPIPDCSSCCRPLSVDPLHNILHCVKHTERGTMIDVPTGTIECL